MRKGVAKNQSQTNFEYQPVSTSKFGSKAKQRQDQVATKSASVANFSLSMISNHNDLTSGHLSILEKGQHLRSQHPQANAHQHIYMSVKNE